MIDTDTFELALDQIARERGLELRWSAGASSPGGLASEWRSYWFVDDDGRETLLNDEIAGRAFEICGLRVELTPGERRPGRRATREAPGWCVVDPRTGEVVWGELIPISTCRRQKPTA
ncbi:MAG TPA: hypothetical protein VMW19_09140 [Myxococcota bacterium]|nr:hypothetical protein [Myxococcota bacterium]